MSEPNTTDLGALRERLDVIRERYHSGVWPNGGLGDVLDDAFKDVKWLLAAYDAQAARLAAVEQALVQALIPLEVLQATERGSIALCADLQDDIEQAAWAGRRAIMAGAVGAGDACQLCGVTAEQHSLAGHPFEVARLAKLAALEQAARVWREDQTIEAEAVLCDAIADLDAPSGEGA